MNDIRKKKYIIYLYRITCNYINLLIIGFINLLLWFNTGSRFKINFLLFFIFILVFFVFKLIIKRFKNIFGFIIAGIASTIYFLIAFACCFLLFDKGN